MEDYYFYFIYGMMGALLTVYIAKQEVIPEFRPLFDIGDKIKEQKRCYMKIEKTQDELDNIQLEMKDLQQDDDITILKIDLMKSREDSIRNELDGYRERQKILEGEIKQGQYLSRGIGFIIYILFGGIFAMLLVETITIEKFDMANNDFIKSLIIGATWTSYLSLLGFSKVGSMVDDEIDATKGELKHLFIEAVRDMMYRDKDPRDLVADWNESIDETLQMQKMVLRKIEKGYI